MTTEYKKFCDKLISADIDPYSVIENLVEQKIVSWNQLYHTINILVHEKEGVCYPHRLVKISDQQVSCIRCAKEYTCHFCAGRYLNRKDTPITASPSICMEKCHFCDNVVEYWYCSRCNGYMRCFC
jgi:hypothetical protein